MPQVSEVKILELQKIIKEDYGREVSLKEATEIANDLVGYFDTLGKIYHRMKTENSNETEKENN